MQSKYSKEQIKIFLKLLADKSELATQLLSKEKLEVVDVLENDFFHRCKELSFHPSGACGCLELNDDYFLAIRCDHLMWAEGWCEDLSDFKKDNVIFIYGNHKGLFKAQLIVGW